MPSRLGLWLIADAKPIAPQAPSPASQVGGRGTEHKKSEEPSPLITIIRHLGQQAARELFRSYNKNTPTYGPDSQ